MISTTNRMSNSNAATVVIGEAVSTRKPTGKRSPQPKPSRKASPKQSRNNRRAAAVLGALAATLLGVSVTHLAEGFAVFTHSPMWQAWLLAIAFDASQLACEGAMVAVADSADRTTRKLLHGVTLCCTVVSMGMNVAAFTSGCEGNLSLVFCTTLGLAIPLLVLALGQAATRLATR